ncbi:hypothetical protein CA850_07845 [Micromonospora echinospora]|uniref:DUF3592 domain-containing protein n=1 Tax=Micromonospora echinospora TaxID=1877 RepID=A0A1C4X6V6_MICEC|nr:DUF3592 domain-containing protein [Micromonospora echinospora]OZV82212.1 hypothetical protein CA850_07845 [Micromonospora echinospora]SCF04150.1 hypothetical protein GA0070618_2805 [Micromonospora echinospora]
MFQTLLAGVFGCLFLYGGIRGEIDSIRLHRRGKRADGVFVGRVDASIRPGVQSRAGEFQFVTADGQEVTATSSFSSFPGPKPGRRVKVIYDPNHPHDTAERVAVHWGKMTFLAPLFMLLGGGMVAVALNGLL